MDNELRYRLGIRFEDLEHVYELNLKNLKLILQKTD